MIVRIIAAMISRMGIRSLKMTEDSRAALISEVIGNIGKVIVGKDETIRLLLTSIIAEGHVLLEDVPGTGKTVLAKTLARTFDMDFSRIQFTPDLLPSDVTGLNYYNQQESAFTFRPGPVFTNILLADEINRATPRTQSALLECMEERQVTVDGETRALEAPFFVIATQNPVETSGTFPLPEAQLDRFIMKLSVGTPTRDEEVTIMNRFLRSDPLRETMPVCPEDDLLDLQQAYKDVKVHPDLIGYIADIVEATRSSSDLRAGVSPRGTLAMLRAVRAYAMISGRDYAVPEDIKALAVPVLAHRLVFPAGVSGPGRAESLICRILESTPVPTEEWK